jgi:hypothetical protein
VRCRPARAAFAFTVAGDRPVRPSGSQDTHAQTPNATCDSATFASDKALGARLARAFALAGFPVSADLLAHFLTGQGTEVNYRAGSPIAKKARASEAFRARHPRERTVRRNPLVRHTGQLRVPGR